LFYTKLYFKREWFFISGIFIAFNIMLSNYLYEFDSGSVSDGGTLRFILKFFSVFLLFLSQPFPSKLLIKKNSLIIFSFILFLISYMIYIPFSTWNEPQFFNMYFVIFILFGIGYNQKFIPKLNNLLIYIFLFIWFPVDIYSFFLGNSLWENKAFIGGMGNPSSYGIIIIYLLFINKGIFKPFRESVINVLLTFSLLFTQALMPILIMFILSFFLYKKRNILLILVSLILFFLIYPDFLLESFRLVDFHWFLKLQSLFEYGLSSSNESASVYYRLEYFKSFYELFENPFVLLFGHVDGVSYNAGDGQYIAYATSFGIPLFFFFLFSLFKIFYESKFFNLANGFRIKLFFVAFLLILVTNRYLDYWPNAIIIFLLINHLNYFKNEYRNNKSISI
tara:strand:- start:9123 stop:10301 length:1179 start_codon:yes stop_codon:yes gene_type:complete